MTPRQIDARRRIDAIYGDQSHPYWQGDPGATEEMAGYFRVLHPEPEVERSGDAAPLLRGQGVPVPEDVQVPFSRRNDVLGLRSPGVTVGRDGAVGYETGNLPPHRTDGQRTSYTQDGAASEELAASRPPAPPLAGVPPGVQLGRERERPNPAPASSRGNDLGYYLGPHLTEGLNNLGKLFAFSSPGADVRDAMASSQAAADAFRRGNIRQGLLETTYVPASLAGLFIPGSARGYRKGEDVLGGPETPSAPLADVRVHDIPYPSWYRSPLLGGEDEGMVQVFERPSKGDVAKLLKKHGALRGVRDTRTGDLYVWSAEEALHEEILRHLNLSESGENVGQIMSVGDFEKLTR